MNNSNADQDSEFVDRSRRAFAASVASLDEAIVLRLQEARQRALAEADRHHQPVWRAHPWTLPVGAAAVVCAVVIGSLIYSKQDQQMAVPFAAASNNNDMAIVLSSDNLDMYADMDFYRWLQAQEQNQDQPAQEPSGNDDNG